MAKAKQHREALLSGGRMDNVIKDYMWQQKHHIDDVLIAQIKGKSLLTKDGNYYKKVVPVMARVYNPITGKIETVNIREHNKRVFSGVFHAKKRKA